jgi:hypothetical protein
VNDVPGNLIPNGENIPLRMEVLTHTYLAKVDDRHDPNVERQHGLVYLVAGDHRDAKTFRRHCVCLEPFRLCVALKFR